MQYRQIMTPYGDRQMKHHFQTVSSAKKNMLVIVVLWAVLSVAALFGLCISLITCALFEFLVLFTCLFLFILVSETKWVLDFENATLTLTNTANHRQYRIEELRQNDFIFSQNARQAAKNCGQLKIKDMPFVFNDVKDFEEMKAYIRAHFD